MRGMPFVIIETQSFWNDYSTLQKNEQDRVERFIQQLAEKGDLVGQPLGVPFIREKKFDGNRLYFLVYHEWNIILLWGISGKKDQPVAISEIKQTLNELRDYVQKKAIEISARHAASKGEDDPF